MPVSDWKIFAEFELYEKEFPNFQHENVQHTYRTRDGIEDKEGLLVINPFFIRFIEYAFSGILTKTINGYAGKLLQLSMENIDDLRCGTKGKEMNSYYIFEKSVRPSEKISGLWRNSAYHRNLVYVDSAQRFGMRFHFKSQSELESTVSNYKTSRDSMKELLSKIDKKLLGKECPFCGSPHLEPYVKETVKCGSCGKLHSPEKLKSLKEK